MRQWNPPDTSAGWHEGKFGDVLGQMLVESWSDDFKNFLNVVAAALAEKDGLSFEEARDHVKNCYRTFIAPTIVEILLKEPNVSLIMPLIVQMVQSLIRRGPGSMVRKFFHKLYRRASWIPVNAVNGLALLTYPSSAYRADVKPIHEFLTLKPPSSDF